MMSWNLPRTARNVLEIIWLMVCGEHFVAVISVSEGKCKRQPFNAVVNCHRMRCVQVAWLYSRECCSEMQRRSACIILRRLPPNYTNFCWLQTHSTINTLYWLLPTHVINWGRCSQDQCRARNHISRIPSFERAPWNWFHLLFFACCGMSHVKFCPAVR